MYTVGEIVGTHGINGEVKVKQISDFNDRFQVGNSLIIKAESGEETLKIKKSRTHKQMQIIQFDGYENINDVEKWKGSHLYIMDDQLKELAENEFYYHEIIGCTVFTTEGEKLGVIDSILAPGANDVWVVKGEHNNELLIPYIEDVVKEVLVNEKQVIIELMEGLID